MIEYLLQNKWVALIVLLVLLVTIAKVFHIIIFAILMKIASLTKTEEDDKFFKRTRKTVFWLFLFIGIFMFKEDIFFFANQIFIRRILMTFILYFVSKIVINIINLIVNIGGEKFAHDVDSDIDDQLLKLSHGAITGIIYAIAFIYALTIWGIEILPVLGSLGVAGLAVALALQEPLQNLFGGVQILLDKNLKKGHIIQLSTGESGVIYDITLRSTRIKTWEGKLVIIPNKLMASTTITNISLPDTRRRVEVSFGVEYGTDPDYVKAIVLEEMMGVEKVELEDPAPAVVFEGMGDNAINFSARAWVNELGCFLSVKQEITTKIYDRLNFEGIGIPFPQRTVWFKDESKLKPKKYEKKKIPSKKKKGGKK